MNIVNNQKSIAVLPFLNTSGDIENQYFADGISEEIINTLSKIEGLKVTSRTSSYVYRDKHIDARKIGNELGVSTLLEGSVRKAGNRIRISTQLVRTDSGFQIWSERYDRDLIDIFDLQDEISLLIAEKIREQFGHFDIQDDFGTPKTAVTAAYQAYLKGRYYQLQWTRDSIEKAQEAFKECIALDPKYPMAYLALSQTFVHWAAWSQADPQKAIYMAQHFLNKVDQAHQSLAEFHYTKALYFFMGSWNFKKAEMHVGTALNLNPNYSQAIELRADLYNLFGDWERAIHEIDKAIAIDPNAQNHYYTKALSYFFQEKYEQAVKILTKALEIIDNWQMALELKALCFLSLRDKASFNSTVQSMPDSPKQVFVALWKAYNNEEIVSSLTVTDFEYYLAIPLYLKLYNGNREEALQLLAEGVKLRSGRFLGFRHDPLISPLRADSTFKKLEEPYVAMAASTAAKKTTKAKEKEVLTEEEVLTHAAELENLMQKERVFTDPQLSLRTAARLLELHPNKLSWLVNKKVGKRFNEYVNEYRLSDFRERVLQPENQHLTLLGMAYDSGFNSKSVFNEFFKKQTGMTPKAWVKANS